MSRRFRWFVTSRAFEYVIFLIIVLNTVSLACKHYPSGHRFEYVLDVLNLVFTGVFAFEAFFKIIGSYNSLCSTLCAATSRLPRHHIFRRIFYRKADPLSLSAFDGPVQNP